MSIFAPVHRPARHQQTFLVRQQREETRKRKRGQGSDDEDEFETLTRHSPELDEIPRTASTAFHPVNKTDPYYVAGHARELTLPPPPFPHAAVKPTREPKRSIEEQLAELNPPLYLPSTFDDKSTSLRRRHLDNLTIILHRCMLKGDWKRAFRAWGLIIRTEIEGRGIDVRRNGRWGIGAELLMRRGGRSIEYRRDDSLDDDIDDMSRQDGAEDSLFTTEGFKLAREYYERLILQYPHTARTARLFNATIVYPALFNIWVYEVQDRAKRARKALCLNENDDVETSSNSRLDSSRNSQLQQIISAELEQALQIARRMDELFLSPPYDTNKELLHLRGMVGRWGSFLHDEIADLLTGSRTDRERDHEDSIDVPDFQAGIEAHRSQAEDQRRKTLALFEKAAVK